MIGATVVSVLLMAGPFAANASAGCKWTKKRPHAASLEQLSRATGCLINRKRDRHRLKRLDRVGRLDDAAQRHSRDMTRRRYFSHTGSDGSSPYGRVQRTGYLSGSSSYAVGENIAWGKAAQGRATAVVRGWMRSSGHRRIILEKRFRHVGVGVARGSPFKGGPRGGVTYTAVFGRR